MKENKVSKDVALEEFESMCVTMGVETIEDELDSESQKTYQDAKRRVVRAIMRGHVTIDNGVPTVHCDGGEVVTFVEPTGDVFLVPGAKDTDMRQMFKIAGALTKGKAQLARRKMPDFRVLMSLTGLFMSM